MGLQACSPKAEIDEYEYREIVKTGGISLIRVRECKAQSVACVQEDVRVCASIGPTSNGSTSELGV